MARYVNLSEHKIRANLKRHNHASARVASQLCYKKMFVCFNHFSATYGVILPTVHCLQVCALPFSCVLILAGLGRLEKRPLTIKPNHYEFSYYSLKNELHVHMSLKLIFRGIFSEETESHEFQTQWLISENEVDSTRKLTSLSETLSKILLKLNGALWYSASTTRCSRSLPFVTVPMSTTLVFLGLALSSLALWYVILHNRGLPWFQSLYNYAIFVVFRPCVISHMACILCC